jgi:hypothetical protein
MAPMRIEFTIRDDWKRMASCPHCLEIASTDKDINGGYDQSHWQGVGSGHRWVCIDKREFETFTNLHGQTVTRRRDPFEG